MASFKPVTAALRGFEVLAAVNQLGEASVGQIHKLIGLNLPTIVRMLETLQHAGYVVKHPERPAYLPTGRTVALSVGYEPYREMSVVATDILAALHRSVGWPSDLGVYDGDTMLVVHTSRDERRLSFNRRPGYRAPILATSLGRAYLAHCSEAERAKALERAALVPAPWNDIARDPAGARALFAKVRADGFALMHEDYSDQEYGGQFLAIGTPVRVKGETVAALNMMLVREVGETPEQLLRFVRPLRQAADALGDALAAVRTPPELPKAPADKGQAPTGPLVFVDWDWMPDA